MFGIVSTLVVIVSLLLILIVLVQNSKGGGLASNFSSSNQVMGVRKTTDFLEKATWTLASILLVLSFLSVMTLRPEKAAQSNALDEKMKQVAPMPTSTPNFQVSQPEQGAATTEQAPAEQPKK
jgi:preprotein translocase subunit SecG